MKPAAGDCVRRALVDAPAAVAAWPPLRWDLLIRQARRAGLLGRVAARLDAAGRLADVPAGPRGHLLAALTVVRAQHDEIRREARLLGEALGPLGMPLVLLKGAAYVVGGRAAAAGRLAADIDILVPRERLPEVEATLMLAGWAGSHHSAYDQRYYREWMHELPPMRHVKRGTTLDVHHAIVPLTARLRPDSARLFAASQPLAAAPPWRVLSPEDLVLHSATHLFQNEEFSHGLRDLSDLDLLLRESGADGGFWQRLPGRAVELGLTQPLRHALRCAQALLATPVPARACEALRMAPADRALAMDALWRRALAADHPSSRPAASGLAMSLLMVRGHWQKMPPALLLRHLATKPFRRALPR